MKKTINPILLALASLVMTNNIDAKQMRQTITVTLNEKKMLIDATNLKNAQTPADKEKAAEKLAMDLKKDPYIQLLLEKEQILSDINTLENQIAKEGSYISYFDTEAVQRAKADLKTLRANLDDVTDEINEAKGIKPVAVTSFKEKALYATIGTLTLGTVLYLMGYDIAGTIGTGLQSVGSKLTTAGQYFKPTGMPEGSDTWLGAAGTLATGIAISEIKGRTQAYLLKEIYNRLMSLANDPNINPETQKQFLKKAEKIYDEIELEEQITQQRNLKPETK